MKIRTIKVHNFRSIADVSVRVHDYTLVVGANNGGKSNLVDAIRCFYGESQFDKERDLPRAKGIAGKDGESYVQIEFSEVDSKVDLGPWEEFKKKRTLHVRRYLASPDSKMNGRYCVVGMKGDPLNKAKVLQKLPAGMGKITYIPSMSKPAEELRTTGPSALRDLIGDVFSETVESSKEYRKFKKVVEQFSKEMHALKNANGFSIDAIEEKVNGSLGNWNAQFRVGLKTLSPQDILKGLLTVSIEDRFAGENMELDQFGSGFQRSVISELIKTKAMLASKAKSEVPRLLIFEEPEAFLHQDQQEELARSLREIAEHGTQVICTSHSQAFVSRKIDDMTGIVRLARNNGVTVSYQIDVKSWAELKKPISPFDENLDKHVKRRTFDLDYYRYVCWFDSNRSNVFFSTRALLVEGATESALIARLVDDGKLKLPAGTIVIDCLGKFNYFRFIRLLNAYGIKLAAVIDSDSGKTGKKLEEHRAWNDFIKSEVDKCNGNATFWKIPNDLEDYLRIKPVEKDDGDLKPYNVLNEYGADGCDKKQLEAFCRKIEELLR